MASAKNATERKKYRKEGDDGKVHVKCRKAMMCPLRNRTPGNDTSEGGLRGGKGGLRGAIGGENPKNPIIEPLWHIYCVCVTPPIMYILLTHLFV